MKNENQNNEKTGTGKAGVQDNGNAGLNAEGKGSELFSRINEVAKSAKETVKEKVSERTWLSGLGIALQSAGGAVIATGTPWTILGGAIGIGLGAFLLWYDDKKEKEKSEKNKLKKELLKNQKESKNDKYHST